MKVCSLTRCCKVVLALVCLAPAVQAATPAELLAGYTVKAGAPASAERGHKLYATNFGREMGWSCASCHGNNPAKEAKDQMTEKRLAALAPAFNPARFTDASKVEHFFRLNCKDVLGRECTVLEKADVLTWLLTLKP